MVSINLFFTIYYFICSRFYISLYRIAFQCYSNNLGSSRSKIVTIKATVIHNNSMQDLNFIRRSAHQIHEKSRFSGLQLVPVRTQFMEPSFGKILQSFNHFQPPKVILLLSLITPAVRNPLNGPFASPCASTKRLSK